MCQRLVGQQQLLQQKQFNSESVTPSPSYGPGTSTFMDTFRSSVLSSIQQQPSCEPSLDVSPSPGERSRNSPNIAVSTAQRVLSSPMQPTHQQFERTLPHALHNNYSNQLHQNPSPHPSSIPPPQLHPQSTNPHSQNFIQACVNNPSLVAQTSSINSLNQPQILLPPYLQTLYNQSNNKSNDLQQFPFLFQ